jgi:hypothetical protein
MGTEESAPNTREAETGFERCTCRSHPGTWCHECGTDRPILRVADDVAEVMRRYNLSGPDGARAAEYILGLERKVSSQQWPAPPAPGQSVAVPFNPDTPREGIDAAIAGGARAIASPFVVREGMGGRWVSYEDHASLQMERDGLVRENQALGMRLANQRKELRQLNRRQQSLFPAHVHNGTRPASPEANSCCAVWRGKADHFEKKLAETELARVGALSTGDAASQSMLIGSLHTRISNQRDELGRLTKLTAEWKDRAETAEANVERERRVREGTRRAYESARDENFKLRDNAGEVLQREVATWTDRTLDAYLLGTLAMRYGLDECERLRHALRYTVATIENVLPTMRYEDEDECDEVEAELTEIRKLLPEVTLGGVNVAAVAPVRPETGPMQFGEDWPGVFIRGDNAGYFALHLTMLLEMVETTPVSVGPKLTCEDLARTLGGCIVGAEGEAEKQIMREFALCVRGAS